MLCTKKHNNMQNNNTPWDWNVVLSNPNITLSIIDHRTLEEINLDNIRILLFFISSGITLEIFDYLYYG